MDYNYIMLIARLIFSLVIVLGIIYLISKVTSKKLNDMNVNKNIKVLERTQISKDTMISVVKVGDKGYVLATSQQKCDKIDDLSLEEIEKIEASKKTEMMISQDNYREMKEKIKKIINKFKQENKKYT